MAAAAVAGVEFSDCAFGFLGFAGFFFSCFAGFSFSFAPSLAANGKKSECHYLFAFNTLEKTPRLSQSGQKIFLNTKSTMYNAVGPCNLKVHLGYLKFSAILK